MSPPVCPRRPAISLHQRRRGSPRYLQFLAYSVFAYLLVSIPGVSRAGTPPDAPSPQDVTAVVQRAFTEAASERGLSTGEESRLQATYFIYVNVSANEQNGQVGLQIRQSLRQLMNRFFVQGERVVIRTFQTEMLGRMNVLFDVADRAALYDRTASFVSQPGTPQGGSDLEVAKKAMLDDLRQSPSYAIGIILTNSDIGQQPRNRAPRWSDDPSHVAQVATESEKLGVKFRLFSINNGSNGESPHGTLWVDLATRPGAAPAALLPQSRDALIRNQNLSAPAIPQDDAVPMLKGERLNGNTIRLSWVSPSPPADSYRVRLREDATGELVGTYPTRLPTLDVRLPRPNIRYRMTVAAVQGDKEGIESDPVWARGGPPPPSSSLLPLLEFVAAVLALVVLFLPKTRVKVNDASRTISARSPGFSLINQSYGKRKSQDLVIADYPSTGVVFAEVRRGWMGNVVLHGRGGHTVSDGIAKDVGSVTLTRAVKQLFLTSPSGDQVTVSVQIIPN